MNAYVNIGSSEVLALKGALLVYQGKSRGFVTGMRFGKLQRRERPSSAKLRN